MSYWEIIDMYRLKKSYSWYRLSQLTNISQGTLNTAKSNNRPLSFEATCKIVIALEMSLDELNMYKNI